MLLTVVMLATRYITLQYGSSLESITMQENEQNDVTAIYCPFRISGRAPATLTKVSQYVLANTRTVPQI